LERNQVRKLPRCSLGAARHAKLLEERARPARLVGARRRGHLGITPPFVERQLVQGRGRAIQKPNVLPGHRVRRRGVGVSAERTQRVELRRPERVIQVEHDETRQHRFRWERVYRWWMGCGIKGFGRTRLFCAAAHEWWLLLARPCLAKRLVGWKHEAVAQQRRREHMLVGRQASWPRARTIPDCG
jgi:hypothetical protein